MYFSDWTVRTIVQLHNTLLGYSEAIRRHQIEENEQPPFWAFSNWIAWRLSRESTCGWLTNILDDSVDEHHAYQRFYELVNDYQKRQWEVVAVLRLRHERPRPIPLEVRLIQLVPDPVFFFQFVFRHRTKYEAAPAHSIEANQHFIRERFHPDSERWEGALRGGNS
jgi:hypothetical protein